MQIGLDEQFGFRFGFLSIHLYLSEFWAYSPTVAYSCSLLQHSFTLEISGESSINIAYLYVFGLFLRFC